eukprot:scaffold37254_cov36-Phaeocystis_antarctica.AAC.2
MLNITILDGAAKGSIRWLSQSGPGYVIEREQPFSGHHVAFNQGFTINFAYRLAVCKSGLSAHQNRPSAAHCSASNGRHERSVRHAE